MLADMHSSARGHLMLRSALGPAVLAALADPDIVEIMINPDGRLWTDRVTSGRRDAGVELQPVQVERIIRLVASHTGQDVDRDGSIVSADLVMSGQGRERFEGVLPPIVDGPCFVIRKHQPQIRDLDEYGRAGLLDSTQITLLRTAVHERRNILIAGGTGTGKTTLANALLAEIATLGDRVILIEDTRELQCAVDDRVALKTRDKVATMHDLVRSSLRMRPDRIIVGEVRGGEALDLLKAWNTGHPGGIATIHANDMPGALIRLEQLALEAAHRIPRALIAEAVDLIILIEGRGQARRIAGIACVTGVGVDGQWAFDGMTPSLPPKGDRHAQAL